jgi:hypothetical protein
MEDICQELNNDNQTVISDITELVNEEVLFNELKTNLNIELNKLTLDNLKEKCKEVNVTGLSKLKKPELVQTLETEFFKLNDILKNKKKNELKNMVKNYGIKKLTSTKKEVLIYRILSYHLTNMMFKIDESKFQNDSIQNDSVKNDCVEDIEPEQEVKQLTLIEQLELQKQEIEKKMLEEIKRKEDEEKQKIEEQKRIEEEERKKKDEEEKKTH